MSSVYRDADKSVARPGKKQANFFFHIGVNFLRAPCLAGKKKLDDSSRLDVVETARVPDMLPSFFLSWLR